MLLTGLFLTPSLAEPARTGAGDALLKRMDEVEKRVGGRLGAVIVDLETGRRWSRRADERFPMNSTFKAFACAGVLARVDAGEEDLGRRIAFGMRDLIHHSPVTEKRAGTRGLTLAELCEATIGWSDNTAGNLVLDAIGGPPGFTAFMRSLGDTRTRIDRREPELTQNTPGDPRDTTTPNAIVATLQALLLGDALSSASRGRLERWMVEGKVTGPLLRSGLPEGWRIADKSGAGRRGSRGIVAVIWPPERQPVVAAIYMAECACSMAQRNAAIAAIAPALFAAIGE
ncbi:class A beta-lactamase [Nitratireductor pacificus]